MLDTPRELFLQRDANGRPIPPNVRKLFIPDPGYLMFEADLKGADAQVVAWEAEDDDLKRAFSSGLDLHVKNATDMWGSAFTSLPEGSHARDFKRQECKHTVHGIHYGCTPRTTAIQRGWTVHEAERFHTRWLSLHPGVATNFHGKHRRALERDRTIWNRFGFRRVFFDRPDKCFTEALAWTPQSTVAINSYLGALQLEASVPQVEILLQDHDSLVFQIPIANCPRFALIQKTLLVETPYEDPLFIPWDLKVSAKSWGEMEKIDKRSVKEAYPALI